MWSAAWKRQRKKSSATVAAISSAVLGAAVATVLDETGDKKRTTMAQSAQPTATSSFPKGLTPTSPIYVFQPNDNLQIAFDTRSRNPLYVMERLVPPTKGSQQQRLKRSNFYEEKSLPEEFRSRQSHYRNSGFDRGHLAAAANYMDKTQEEVGQTFNLINVSPQNHSMNTSIWNHLERWTKKVAEQHSSERLSTYVITGPLWMPTKQSGIKLFEFHYNAIGSPPSLVTVPTHLFKVVAVVADNQSIIKYACFVVPNQDPIEKRPLEHYLVQWTNLEAVVGVHFFPGFTLKGDWKQRANKLTNDITSSNRISSGHQPLLLTDGADQTEKSWASSKTKSPLEHLCAKGNCR